MDCRKTQTMITPCLDGALTKTEEAALRGHAAGCGECARELALQERLSGALKALGREEIEAPPELRGLVMAGLQRERRTWRTALAKLPALWQKAVAVAATILLLVGGTAGINAGLKLAGEGKLIGYQAPAPDHVKGDALTAGDGPDTGDPVEPGLPKDIPGDPGGDPGAAAAGTGDTNGGVRVNGDGWPAGGEAGDASGKTPAGGSAGIASIGGQQALLSNGIHITSTLLKVAVNDTDEARARAVALAAGAEASTQVFPEQVGSQKIVVVRLTVASELAPGLISGLAGIGTLTDRQDESRDITLQYNEMMVEYHNLKAGAERAATSQERRALETQAAAYKQQLDAWQHEAGKRVIMLWLETR